MTQFHEDGHLGGCVIGGDPATYYPKMWDFFITNLGIKSVFDLGCGEGQALSFFRQKCKVLGVDGCRSAVEASELQESIGLHDFNNGPYHVTDHFDMVWSCEFVEHVKPEYRDNFLETIRRTKAEYVFLTHAFPTQGGYHHVNCQLPSYWIHHLSCFGYELSPRLTRMARAIAVLEGQSENNHFYRSGLVFVKKKLSFPRKDAIITWASGKDFCKLKGLKAYMNSLNSCGFDGDKIIFTHDMEVEDREYIQNQGFEIVDVDPNEIEWVVRDRFLAWYKFLSRTYYRYVALLDCKDVIFQTNPIHFLESHNHNKIFLVGEGKKHSQCNWNLKDQEGCQLHTKTFKSDYTKWEVICAGTILGYAESIKEFIMHLWSTTLMTTHCTDQAVLNFLYNEFYAHDPNVFFADPKECCLCATADLPAVPAPAFFNGLNYNSKLNEPYCIWHQWDRTIHKKTLEDKYA